MRKLSFKILDGVIIGVLIAASLLSAGMTVLKDFGKSSNNIVIKVDNKMVRQINIDKDTSSKIYDFKFKDNTGYIEVKNGKVRMLEMDKTICHNVICSDTGWISKSYETIVCLPNNIIVTLEGSQYGEVDS